MAVKVTDLRPRFETKEENDQFFRTYFNACRNEFDMLWTLTKTQREKRAVKVHEIGTDSDEVARPYGKTNYLTFY